jgi:hypothetical protein
MVLMYDYQTLYIQGNDLIMKESTDLHADLTIQDPRLLLVNNAGVSHIETLATLAAAVRLMRGELWRNNYRLAKAQIFKRMVDNKWSAELNKPEIRQGLGRVYTRPTLEVYSPIRCSIWIDHKRPHARGVEIMANALGTHCKVILLAGCNAYDMATDRRQYSMFDTKQLSKAHAIMSILAYRSASIQVIPPVLVRGDWGLNWTLHTPEVLEMVTAAWEYGEPLSWRADTHPSHHFQAVMDKRFGWHPKVTRACFLTLQKHGAVMKSRNRQSGITGLRVVPKIELDSPRVGEFQAPDSVVPALSGLSQIQAPYLSDSVLN